MKVAQFFLNSTTLLQGTFSNFDSILKFEFGVHLSIWIISKLLQIVYVTLKTLNTKVDPYKIIFNFAICINPKFHMDFELDKRGKKDFYDLNLNSNLICLPFYLTMIFYQLHGPLWLFESIDTWSHTITWNLTLVVIIFI